MNSEEFSPQQQQHQDETVPHLQSSFSDQYSNNFSQFIQSLTVEERLLELDNQHLQENFSIKEHNSTLTLDAAQRTYSHMLNKNKQVDEKRIKKNWTDDETSLLLWIAEIFSHRLNKDPINFDYDCWMDIAKMIPNKTFDNCQLRWLYLKKSCAQSISWTPEEDDCLIQIIKKKGTNSNKWNEIAKELQSAFPGQSFRKGKQCRERWNNHLDPDMKRGDWTLQEDLKLLQLSYEKGNKWSYIARQLKERTENAVKNRYKSLIRKEEKELKMATKNETQIDNTVQLQELMQQLGVDTTQYQSPEQLKLLEIIRKLKNSIDNCQDQQTIEEENEDEGKENCQDISEELNENGIINKNYLLSCHKTFESTPTADTTSLTHKSEIHFCSDKKTNSTVTTVLNSIFTPLNSPDKPHFLSNSNFSSTNEEDNLSQTMPGSITKPQIKATTLLKTSFFEAQQNTKKELVSNKKKNLKRSKDFSNKNEEVCTFSDAFMHEKEAAKRRSQESDFSNSTASSYTQGIQLFQQFPHRTSFQSCGTPAAGNQSSSKNSFYSPSLPPISPCSLLIQQFNNLEFSSCENTPASKKQQPTYHDGSDPFQTLRYFDIIHKQRKLSAMTEESEKLSPAASSKNSTMRKVIVLTQETPRYEQIPLANSESNNITKTTLIEQEIVRSNSQETSSAATLSQVNLNLLIHSLDDPNLRSCQNKLQYSGQNNSAFRQFFSPLQVSKVITFKQTQIEPTSQNNHQLDSFSSLQKIQPLVLSPPLALGQLAGSSLGFVKNQNFKTLKQQESYISQKQFSQLTPITQSQLPDSSQSVSEQALKAD